LWFELHHQFSHFTYPMQALRVKPKVLEARKDQEAFARATSREYMSTLLALMPTLYNVLAPLDPAAFKEALSTSGRSVDFVRPCMPALPRSLPS
jgi:hypothetical protein